MRKSSLFVPPPSIDDQIAYVTGLVLRMTRTHDRGVTVMKAVLDTLRQVRAGMVQFPRHLEDE